jgi:hypothetical protein
VLARRLDGFGSGLGGRMRRLVGRIPPTLVMVAVLFGSWWLDQGRPEGGPPAVSQQSRHVAAARRAGRVVWVAEPGRHIASGEVVARIEGGESNGEVRAPIGGSVSAVLKKIGDVAAVGEAVVIVAAGLEPGTP